MIKQKSIKYNFIFNLMRNLSSILFPMITLPYLSRVLQPEGIGKINFADQFVAYFVILASLVILLMAAFYLTDGLAFLLTPAK